MLVGSKYGAWRAQVGDMPSKSRITREHWAPPVKRVPIVADRVAAALTLAGVSNAEAARRMTLGGFKVTAQAVNDIVNGQTKTTHPEIRKGLARIVGRPFTPRFLGGERDIAVPPTPRKMKSGGRVWAWGSGDAQGMVDFNTWRGLKAPSSGGGIPALFEVCALALHSKIEKAWKRDFPAIPIPPELHHLLRKLLAIGHWRSVVNVRSEVGHNADPSRFWKETGEFARLILEAVTLVLRPWFDGEEAPRPYVVSALKRLLEATIAFGDACHSRESSPNTQKVRGIMSEMVFGRGGRLLTEIEYHQMREAVTQITEAVTMKVLTRAEGDTNNR